ncbi:MAG: acetolactate synthase large subunit [Bdellovibrionales bacterium GWA2_49_15]|nr:MAG: acetolactate synthase large subunit [Bdellovibrionales bacterium GWA2_49_15]HAZ11755.1 acetolactate synthase large subunit [Bdellovibrionales bacterium]
MKYTGAYLARFALEQLGVRYTFGIPGVHNTELYDELNNSETITPVLVTHEMGAAFMAEGVSRTSDTVGALVIVPAAGTTHALSGIGEAFLDGIPMLVISGGIRRDSGKSFQLHQLEQGPIVAGITKGYYLVQTHADIIPTLYRAYDMAIQGTPGPVFVEIPSNLLLFAGPVETLPTYAKSFRNPVPDATKILQAAQALLGAKRPGLYVGWGARHATHLLIELAETLQMPVSTTMQGISVFPHDHPLHAGMGFGKSGVPATREAFADVDCLLAVGARFGELATGSYGLPVPPNLIHLDINPEVFDKNYPSSIGLCADAQEGLQLLLEKLKAISAQGQLPKPSTGLPKRIQDKKAEYFREWEQHDSQARVNPYLFFRSLRHKLARDAFVLLDDGNHTFLAAELFPSYESRHLVSPTDFNAMGYCVPAAIGAKLSNPTKQVIGIVGDGGLLMTGMELLTASTLELGVIIFVFHDGELGQISQFQKIPLNRKTCTILGDIKIEGLALATGAHFIGLSQNNLIDAKIDEALRVSATGRPVLVDVNIDYSRKTCFTKGVVSTNLSRFPLGEKVRFIGRALKRHLLDQKE